MTDFNTFPAFSAASITPSDTEGFPVCRAIYVGSAGNIVAVMGDGVQLTFEAAVAGSVLPIRVKQVLSTNTTASALIALY